MAKKEILEEMKNYNRFPGEQVISQGEEVKVGEKVFNLVHNYRDAFDAEKLEQRFSEILTKYDYIVGDWGHEQLRLKGFYSASRKKMPEEVKISSLQDYLDEYCNFGCPFFVIKRLRGKEDRDIVKDFDPREGRNKYSKNFDGKRKPKNKAYTEEKVYKIDESKTSKHHKKLGKADKVVKEAKVDKPKHSFTIIQKGDE